MGAVALVVLLETLVDVVDRVELARVVLEARDVVLGTEDEELLPPAGAGTMVSLTHQCLGFS